ncbi:MAG: hypothetical protein ACD_73C00799G0002 [uncultured bacterium]|nr:MAG: hypothetical protein ACD_73C00799G0002 [uncultured bacterium]
MPAVKMGEYDTSKGKLPLYMIGLDTMDYTSGKSALGAINGHLSPLQIKIVKAFIEQKKKENPNAKFIISGHYPATSIEEVGYSGLSKLLEDESIIAVVGAHHHRRNFINLADKKYQEELGFTRKQPLPQITVPAIMDGPNEITGMKYGVVNDELVLQFDFLGIDPEKVPGIDSEVKKAFDDIIPQLLSYRDAIQHITDPRIREFALQGTSTARKVYLLLHPDSGLIADSGRLHDHMIARDVIPTMVEDAQLYLRIAENATYLTLTEAGLKAEALNLRNAFYAHQKELDDYYERIHQGQYTNLVEHSAFHKLDEKSDEVNVATYKVLEAIKQKLEADPTTTIKQKELLGKVDHVVDDLHRFQDAYKFWLQRYENLKRADRDDADYVFAADIFSSGYFRSIQQHIEALPYGSKAHAFMTLIFKESAKQRDQFYQKIPDKKIPDHIELHFSSKTSQLSLVPSGPTFFTDAEWQENKRRVGHAPGMDPAINPPEVFHDPKPEEHWVLRAGGSFLQGNNSFVCDFGGRWHLLEGLSAPRLSVEWVAGIKTGGIKGPEAPLKFAFNIGDPFGFIDVGPLLSSGLAYDGSEVSPFLGIGGQTNIREGLLTFNFQHKWYHEMNNKWSGNWELTFNTDIMTLLRSFDILQPGF